MIKKILNHRIAVFSFVLGLIAIVAIFGFSKYNQVEALSKYGSRGSEVKQIQEKYQKFPTAMQAIGYKEVVDYLEGNCTKEEMVEKIKMETRRYAKRQMTWFRKIQEIQWIDGNQSMEEKLSIILGEK